MTESEEEEGRTSWTSSGTASGRKEESSSPFADKTVASRNPSSTPAETSATTFGARSAPPRSDADPDATIFSAKPRTKPSKIGLVLNNIWEVRRLIAQGGMGEVYEAFVKATQETVAIKFLLPQLAADETIQGLFLLEARTLVKLSSDANTALVQYRACANDPNLDETYIVMELVDGPTLGQALPTLKPGPQDLLQFARLLASALQVAHEAGLIHRDISPKNILLRNGELLRAKLIDFGIAKNLATDKTQFGGGFTGTLAYSAPEQFAEGPDRENSPVGPWTDVYSLGLVILAVAAGKPVDMGRSIADAVEKRKRVPDLTALPAQLRSVVAAMLAPDPEKRLRSMAAVVGELNRLSSPGPEPLYKKPVVAIGVAGGALLAGVVATVVWLWPSPPLDPIRARVQASIQSAECTWLNLDTLDQASGAIRAGLSGAAGNLPATVGALREAAGAPVDFDTTAVSSVGPPACVPLNAFRTFREAASGGGLSLAARQREFSLGNDAAFCGNTQARVEMDLRPGGSSNDFTLLAMEPTGRMQQLIINREQFEAAASRTPEFAANLGGDNWRMSFCVDELSAQSGVAALVLIKGAGPFSLGLSADNPSELQAPAEWARQFVAKGQAQRWTTQVAWYRIVGR
jgi:serine/threonine-protein kinase